MKLLRDEVSSEFALKVIFIDDGSNDNTIDVINSEKSDIDVTILKNEHNMGPGSAFAKGFESLANTLKDDDWVLTMEGDNTSNLSTLLHMLIRRKEGYDVVLASPFLYGGGIANVNIFRLIISHIGNGLVKIVTGLRGIQTFSSFFRLYSGNIILKLQKAYGNRIIETSGFECMVELLIKLVRLEAKISEVEMKLDWKDKIGKSKMKILKTSIGYLNLLYNIYREGKKEKRTLQNNPKKYVIIDKPLFWLFLFGFVFWWIYYINAFNGIENPDAFTYAQVARNIARGEGYVTYEATPQDLYIFGKIPYPYIRSAPAHTFTIAFFYKLFGISDATAVLSSNIAFLLNIFLIYLLAKREFSTKVAIISVLIYLTTERLLAYSINGNVEIGYTFYILLFSYLLFKGISSTNNGLITLKSILIFFASGIVFGICHTTRQSSILFIIPVLICLLIKKSSKNYDKFQFSKSFFINLLPFLIGFSIIVIYSYYYLMSLKIPITLMENNTIILGTKAIPSSVPYFIVRSFETINVSPFLYALTHPLEMLSKHINGMNYSIPRFLKFLDPWIKIFFIFSILSKKEQKVFLITIMSFVEVLVKYIKNINISNIRYIINHPSETLPKYINRPTLSKFITDVYRSLCTYIASILKFISSLFKGLFHKSDTLLDKFKIFTYIIILTHIIVLPLFIVTPRYFTPFIPFIIIVSVDAIVFASSVIWSYKLWTKFVLIAIIFLTIFPPVYHYLKYEYSYLSNNYLIPRDYKITNKYHLLGKFIKDNTSKDDFILTDVHDIVAWNGERKSIWIPVSLDMIPEIDKKIRIDAILLTSLRSFDYEKEWKELYSGKIKLNNFAIHSRFHTYGLHAVLFKRVHY